MNLGSQLKHFELKVTQWPVSQIWCICIPSCASKPSVCHQDEEIAIAGSGQYALQSAALPSPESPSYVLWTLASSPCHPSSICLYDKQREHYQVADPNPLDSHWPASAVPLEGLIHPSIQSIGLQIIYTCHLMLKACELFQPVDDLITELSALIWNDLLGVSLVQDHLLAIRNQHE